MVNKLNRFPVLFDISPSGGATVPFGNAFFIPTALSATFLISCSDRVIFPLSALSLSSDDSRWPDVSQSAPASAGVELCKVQVWGCSWLGPAKALFDKNFFSKKIFIYTLKEYLTMLHSICMYIFIESYTFTWGIVSAFCVSAFCMVPGRLFRLLKKTLQSNHFVSHWTDSDL